MALPMGCCRQRLYQSRLPVRTTPLIAATCNRHGPTAMATRHQLTDDLQARQDVADEGNADHRDVGRVRRHRGFTHFRLSAAASRSAMLPDMIVRTCSVMCSAGQSHQATASSRAMSSSW